MAFSSQTSALELMEVLTPSKQHDHRIDVGKAKNFLLSMLWETVNSKFLILGFFYDRQ